MSYSAICKKDSVTKNKLNQIWANKKFSKKAENILLLFSNQLPQRNKNLHQTRHQALDHQIFFKNKKNNMLHQNQEQQKSPLSSNMNSDLDAKTEKRNIPKDRMHEAKKDNNQQESDKFDSNNLYFSSQTDTSSQIFASIISFCYL